MSTNQALTSQATVSSEATLRLGAALYSAVPMAAILLAQMAFGVWIHLSHPVEADALQGFPIGALLFLVVYVPLGMVFICVYRMVWFTRPVSPVRALLAGTRAYMLDTHRLCNGLIVLALMVPFMMMFGAIKASIPIVAPFSWDITLSEWDRAIFFGFLPFEWLQPIVGYRVVTLFLDVAYKVWFVLMWMSLIAFAFARSVSALRTRYIMSFLLTWFLQGSVLAIGLSSAGPCFYHLLQIGPDPYEPLMTYLHEARLTIPVMALDMQAYLWSGYEGHVEPLGISAAPSLHNATSLLMALAAWKVNRKLGLILYAFAFVIFVGSISLAWHYAVDGLIAFPVTLVVWIASGRFADWWEERPEIGRG